MRLHELSATAFGPFVDTVHVDFDDLAVAGLFLLTGDTGAGKTSVLDAVCFGLYGEVPGDRHTARHLRSDHAEPHAEPSVCLRFSVGTRTFRFTRSPAWDRPRRRGEGTRRIQAHVVAEELLGSGWTVLSNRLDETGHLVIDLLGMSCSQFTQVAMLPQGRFQAFLRASSGERHAVLQRLFRTGRFEDVERWLVDRRIDLRRRSQVSHDRCAHVVSRFHEAAGADELPERARQWDVDDLTPVASDGTLASWTHEVLASCAEARTETSTRLAELTLVAEQRRDRLADLIALSGARARGERARRTLEDLEATQEVERGLVDSLAEHTRALPLVAPARRARVAGEALSAAETAARRHGEAAQALDLSLDVSSREALGRAARRTAEARAVALAWSPRESELAEQRARLVRMDLRDAQAHELVRETERTQEAVTTDRTRLVAALGAARELAARQDRDTAALQSARLGLSAARETEEVVRRLREARMALASATTLALELKEAHLDLRESRISGMAAELAGALAVGCSCPVCGSVEHPHRAVAAVSPVGRADEDAARERHESADFDRQAHQELVTTLETQLLGARRRSEDRESADWERTHESAVEVLEHSSAAVAEVALLADELDRLEARARTAAQRLGEARVRVAGHDEQRQATERVVADLEREQEALCRDAPGVSTVSALVRGLTRSAQVLQDAHTALESAARARDDARLLDDELTSSVVEAGFPDIGVALAAVLSDAEAEDRDATLTDRRAHRSAARSVLADALVADALAQPPPDVPSARAAAQAAADDRDAAQVDHERLGRRSQRLRTLDAELRRCLDAWAPVRQEHALVAALAALVEGKSGDNRWRMRLSAYVLSERLRQVVAAANERLGAMTDDRYTLVQTDEKGAGEQRGGLSLLVRDEWTSTRRDPATLSGGETFLVSLALALGLADTVSHEAGGTQLDTLFIDEGFGTLDATTLDGVMDTLDSLRDGGRVVGLVSHVAELRNRVPAQLEVRKGRRGSTLSPTPVLS